MKGAFTRIGDSDEPMTEYEVYSYEAFRKKYQDDIRGIFRATLSALNQEKLEQYIKIANLLSVLDSLDDNKSFKFLKDSNYDFVLMLILFLLIF